jgi:ligand-binding SRPBCC domain-containing protein
MREPMKLDNDVIFERQPHGACMLRASQRIPLPREQLFPFFSDARNLAVITPPGMGFRIRTPQPIVMGEGTLIDYTVRVAGLPVRWRTLISHWDPPHEFADEQLRGPYALWRHQHRFTALAPSVTQMDDAVLFRLPLVPLGNVVLPFVKRELRRIFRYRHEATARALADGSLAANARAGR